MKNINNARIIARPNEDNNRMHIFLVLSGKRHYLYSPAFSPMLYRMLKPGMSLGSLKRLTPAKYCFRNPKAIARTEHTVHSIIHAAEVRIRENAA